MALSDGESNESGKNGGHMPANSTEIVGWTTTKFATKWSWWGSLQWILNVVHGWPTSISYRPQWFCIPPTLNEVAVSSGSERRLAVQTYTSKSLIRIPKAKLSSLDIASWLITSSVHWKWDLSPLLANLKIQLDSAIINFWSECHNIMPALG